MTPTITVLSLDGRLIAARGWRATCAFAVVLGLLCSSGGG